MKIALLTDGIFPYVVGGMQKHSYYLCKFLAQRGIDIDLYHTTSAQNKYDINELEYFTAAEKKHIHSTVIDFPAPGKMPGHYMRESLEFSERIYEAMQKRPPVDFIYSKGLTAWKLLKEKKKGVKFPPISNKAHGYEMFQIHPSFRSRLENYMMRPAFLFNTQQADYIFSYGGNISSILKNQLKVKPSSIVEIPTGIEAEWLYEAPVKVHSPRKFVFLGRYQRRKGVEELTQVLKEINVDHDFSFEFIGPFTESQQLKSDKIVYHGLQTDVRKIKAVLQAADVLVCPSYSEGMPNVIMEGMASSCAIIATNVGAVNIQVSNENGWLIPPADSKALKTAILSAIEATDDVLTTKKNNSIQSVKDNFLWTKIADQTLEQIKRIVNKEKSYATR